MSLETWEQQPKETTKAFAAFMLYRGTETTPGIRLINEVANVIQCSDRNCYKWSRQWKWQDRARDYDRHLARKQEERESAIMIAELAKWRKRRLAEADRIYRTHALIQEKIEQMARWPINTVETTAEPMDGGKTLVVNRFVPSKWRLRDMAAMLNMSIKAMDHAFGIVMGVETASRPAAEEDAMPAAEAAAALKAIEVYRKELKMPDVDDDEDEDDT